jgi:hypothetical protein
MGDWSNISPVGVGTMPVAGMATSLGKMLSGSSRLKVMVESFSTTMPATASDSPLLNARAPRMGYRGQGRPPSDFGESARDTKPRRLRRGPAVRRGSALGAEVEGVVRPGGIHLPGLGEAGHQPALDIELGQVVEEERVHFTGGDVGGVGGSSERGSYVK